MCCHETSILVLVKCSPFRNTVLGAGRDLPSSQQLMWCLQPLHLCIFPCNDTKPGEIPDFTAGVSLVSVGLELATVIGPVMSDYSINT